MAARLGHKHRAAVVDSARAGPILAGFRQPARGTVSSRPGSIREATRRRSVPRRASLRQLRRRATQSWSSVEMRSPLWLSHSCGARAPGRAVAIWSVTDFRLRPASLPISAVHDARARLQGRRSSIGLPCGVVRAASAHSSLRRASSADPIKPLSATMRSRAASQ
jgi:hypothetical protein